MALGQRLLDEGGRKRKTTDGLQGDSFFPTPIPSPLMFKKHFGREILQNYLTSWLFSWCKKIFLSIAHFYSLSLLP